MGSMSIENNATQVAIIEYLDKKENLSVTRPTLSYFIKKHIKKTPYSPKEKGDNNNNNKKKDEKIQNEPKKKSLYLLD
jgi:ribosomal protein L11